jgi:hypothetical protein
MTQPRYLTKSRFKSGLECPTKLFYTRKDQYPDKKLEDPFLAALAKGGFQVGELAKCYFPGGVDIDELDYETALKRTRQLLEQENTIIYEAAFLHGNLFIRADIVIKKGAHIQLIEVKAKSADPDNESMVTKTGLPTSVWMPYCCDIAFQKHVVEQSMPSHRVEAFLMVADKSVTADVDGLNQKFLLKRDAQGRTSVETVGDVSLTALGRKILCLLPVDEIIARIYAEEIFDEHTGSSFKQLITIYEEHYRDDKRLQGALLSHCRKCEFAATIAEEDAGQVNGFKECWSTVHGFSATDFEKPLVMDIWNCRSNKFILEGRFFQADLISEDLMPKTKPKKDAVCEPGMTGTERQILQVTKSKENDTSVFIDLDGLKSVFNAFKYPLHFIDFETTAVAIPFNKGRRPYEQTAFQFSHHMVLEDGTIMHQGEWINTETGVFPNFEFVRQLKKELEQDDGTIFRYAAHENSILNAIYRQLQASGEPDQDELCKWIKTITKATKDTVDGWEGRRNMVDLCELVKRYYYAPETNGSNSIKYVLPAILNASEYLKKKYSQPIYGAVIQSLNFKDQSWIQLDEGGKVINPYHLLPAVFDGVDMDMLDEVLTAEEGEIRDGGAAMIAYAQMQFTEMSLQERELITKSLLKYCELDTLAMVMIWEDWNEQIKLI